MDTQTPPQPTAEQTSTVSPEPTSLVDGKKKNNVLIVTVISICILLVVGLVGYILFMGQPKSQQTAVTIPTTTPIPMPTTNVIRPATAAASVSPALTNTPNATNTMTIKPTLAPNTDGNTFTSKNLGVAFYYSKTMGYDKNTTIKVMESGSKVYLYESSMQPTTGQSIERFEKSATDTLSQAITKKFLTGISTTDCFVSIDPKKPSPTQTRATISYPVPTNADQPNFTYGEKCPEGYSESNGVAYFLEDSTSPDRFYFVKIGQYGIPAYNSKPDSMWQNTITIF